MNKRKRAQLMGLGLAVILTIVLALVIPRVGQARNGVREATFTDFAGGFANVYEQHNLVSDLAGRADLVDPNLVNPWGLAISPMGPWWVANNGKGTSTLHRGDGTVVPNPTSPLVVTVPSANGLVTTPSVPSSTPPISMLERLTCSTAASTR